MSLSTQAVAYMLGVRIGGDIILNKYPTYELIYDCLDGIIALGHFHMCLFASFSKIDFSRQR